MAHLLKFTILLFALVSLSACESDQDFTGVVGSVDIELDNAEAIGTGILQSTVLAHRYSPLDKYLGVSDLTPGSGNLEEIICEGSSDDERLVIDGREVTQPAPGTAIVIITRTPNTADVYEVKGVPENSSDPDPEEQLLFSIPLEKFPESGELEWGMPHEKGDKVTVVYNGCVDEDGLIHNGKVELTYEELSGLNDRYVVISTEACVNNLVDELSLDETPIVVFGENVGPERIEDTVHVIVDGLDSGIVIEKAEKRAVVLVRSNTGVASLDGDLVYSVVDNEWQLESCQRYGRTLRADVDELSTTKDDITTTLDGEITIATVSVDLGTIETDIEDSSFEVEVRQNNLEQEYYYENFNFDKVFNLSGEAMAFKFVSGVVSSNSFDGDLVIGQTFINDTGIYDYPDEGGANFEGRGIESLNIIVGAYNEVLFRVDADGDGNGDGLPDYDATFRSTWSRMLNREFIYAE